MGRVNDYVVSGDHSGFLLAQSALNRGLMGVFKELLTHERGNQFYRLPVSADWQNKTFFELFVHVKREHAAILVAVHETNGPVRVNPEAYQFKAGDEVIVIAEHAFEL